MMRESNAKETVEYNVEPVVIAEACLDELNRIGKIKNISRESGLIAGTVTLIPFPLIIQPTILLRITKRGTTTELSIQTNRVEGFFTGSGAQQAVTKFIEVLGQDNRLGMSSGGW